MLVKVESALPLISLDSSSPRLFLKWLIPDRLMSLQNLSKARCMSVLQRDTARTGRYPQQESANTHSAILAKRDAGDDAQGNREDQCGSGTTSGREITPLAAKGRFNMKEPGLDNRHRDKAKPKGGRDSSYTPIRCFGFFFHWHVQKIKVCVETDEPALDR